MQSLPLGIDHKVGWFCEEEFSSCDARPGKAWHILGQRNNGLPTQNLRESHQNI